MSAGAFLIPLAMALHSVPPDEEPTDAATEPPVESEPDWEKEPPPVDPQVIEGRRRPDYTGPLPDPVTQDNPGAVRAPPPSAFPVDQVPIRWSAA